MREATRGPLGDEGVRATGKPDVSRGCFAAVDRPITVKGPLHPRGEKIGGIGHPGGCAAGQNDGLPYGYFRGKVCPITPGIRNGSLARTPSSQRDTRIAQGFPSFEASGARPLESPALRPIPKSSRRTRNQGLVGQAYPRAPSPLA